MVVYKVLVFAICITMAHGIPAATFFEVKHCNL